MEKPEVKNVPSSFKRLWALQVPSLQNKVDWDNWADWDNCYNHYNWVIGVIGVDGVKMVNRVNEVTVVKPLGDVAEVDVTVVFAIK